MAVDALLREVERIAPVLREAAPEAERTRALTDDAYDAMIDAGLCRMLAPKAFGGLELHPTDVLRVVEAVARIDSAAGWNLNQSNAAAGMAPWLSKDGGEAIYDRGPDTIFAGGLFPPGPSVRVDGGWRVTARSSFASGCHRAQWFAVPILEVVEDASHFDPRREDPPSIVAYVPRDEVDLLDTWHTVGMRGTFSGDVVLDDVFVPDHRVAFLGRDKERAPAFAGALYGVWPWTAIAGETAVSIGIASAAIDDLIDLATRKQPAYSRIPLHHREMAQHHAGKASGLRDASRASLQVAISETYDDVAANGQYSETTAAKCQLAACFGAEACAQAVDLVHEVAGSSAIRLEQPFERYHRDVHVLTQHQYKSFSRYEDIGKLLFGLAPTFWILDL